MSYLDFLFVFFAVSIHLGYRYRRRRMLPLPPGPSRWPIIGNLLVMPRIYPHKYYKNFGEVLGTKLVYFEALGQPIVVINDLNITQDLLEKRSALYSSRPHIPMLHDVIGFKGLFAFMQYGDEWRLHRRMFQQHFSERHLARYEEKTLEVIHSMLIPNLLENPAELRSHVQSYVGGVSMSVTYGLNLQRTSDPRVKQAEYVFEGLTDALLSTKYLVNAIGALKYLPEWMPGGQFKIRARSIRKDLDQLTEGSFQETLKAISLFHKAAGTAPQSFVADTIERCCDSPHYDAQVQYIKQTAVQVFGAFFETTVASVMTFILAMLLHPKVQAKAKDELDRVVGPDRLPVISDLPSLTYLSAIIKEIFRWNPIAPLGAPHATTDEDVYNGYYIPKDCVVITNIYAMLHNEEVFPNPMEFAPERFLKDGTLRNDLPDPEYVSTFGFGRRICPGKHMARSTLKIIAASILHVFDISPALDQNGKPIHVEPKFAESDLVSDPLPFPSKLTPRTDRDVASLLREHS